MIAAWRWRAEQAEAEHDWLTAAQIVSPIMEAPEALEKLPVSVRGRLWRW